MSKIATVCPIWKETRYLPLVLEQMALCPGPQLLMWQDNPLYWLSDKPVPSGFASKVGELVKSYSTIEVIKMDHAPKDKADAPFGGFAGLAEVAFSMLKNKGIDVVIWTDSDWLFDLNELNWLYQRMTNYTETKWWAVEARHYWRSFAQTMATTGITVGFPTDKPDLWHYSEEDIVRMPIYCYHPAYVLSDEEMHDKVNSWGHAPLFQERKFYKNEWLAKNDSIVDPKPADLLPPKSVMDRLSRYGALL